MFLKRLTLDSDRGRLRDIEFSAGLNLIVDETPEDDKRRTGNNVGKTTVLKLINYCLGGKDREIYADPDNTKSSYQLVETYLREQNVVVTLELVDSLDDVPLKRTTIRRNFLKGKKAIREIDGQQVAQGAFLRHLGAVLMPQLPEDDKPTFRQAISHNIRYNEQSLTHTLHTLDKFTRNIEYEALFLFMLGCSTEGASEKQSLAEKRKAQERYIKQLENGWNLRDYELARGIVESQIEKSEREIARFGEMKNSRGVIDELSQVEGQLSAVAGALTQARLRISIIEDARTELLSKRSDADVRELRRLYEEAHRFIPNMQKTFEELTRYHNSMIEEKARFIAEELPALESKCRALEDEEGALSKRSAVLGAQVSGMLEEGDLRRLIDEQNDLFHRKGEYDARIGQLTAAYNELEATEKALQRLEDESQADGLEHLLARQVSAFNKHFAAVSEHLYGEAYVLAFERDTDKAGTEYYRFYLFDATNISSGKKQGEMLCFDIAYTAFADAQGIDCMHFLLNDKKELMRGNQLSKVAETAVENNVQLIVPILSDKVPSEMRNDGTVVLRLSQEDKLFRIEG